MAKFDPTVLLHCICFLIITNNSEKLSSRYTLSLGSSITEFLTGKLVVSKRILFFSVSVLTVSDLEYFLNLFPFRRGKMKL